MGRIRLLSSVSEPPLRPINPNNLRRRPHLGSGPLRPSIQAKTSSFQPSPTDSATSRSMSDATAVPPDALSPTLASDLLNRFPALRAARSSNQPVASTSTLPPSPRETVKELGDGVARAGKKRGRGDDELLELLEAEEREQQQLIGHFNQVSRIPHARTS